MRYSRLKSHQEFYKLVVALGIGLGIAVKFVAIFRSSALDIKLLQFQQTGVYCLDTMADLEKQSLCLPVRNKYATVFTTV